MTRRLICALILLCAATPATGAPTGVISGVVRNAWSRTGLLRAVVTLSTSGPNPMDAVAYSDSNGAFAFTGVPAGAYFLCARYKGYERGCYGALPEPGRPEQHLTLAAGERKTDVVLAMLPLGSVSGTVLDGDGDPVNNAEVRLLRPVYSRRKLRWQAAGQARTNDQGEYRLPFLTPGKYRVMASRPFQIATQIRSEVTNGDKIPDEFFATQFYPNSETVEGAASLTLSAGNDFKGIDFNLGAMEHFTVTGKVLPPAGMETSGSVTVNLVPQSGGSRDEQLGQGLGPPEYPFQFSVRGGPYLLVATANFDDHSYRFSRPLDVSSSVSDLTITLTPGTPLKGKLTLEGEGSAAHGPYKVHLTSGDDLPQSGEPPVAEVEADGSFEFDDVLPGIWDIGVDPLPPGSYIKSMRLGDQDVLTEDMTLPPGARQPLNIVLSMNGAVISGTVMESPDKPAGRVMVLLAPEGKFDNVLSFYDLHATNDKGHFEFKSVTPGRYKIYGFDHLQRGEYWNPEFLKPYVTFAEAFDVAEGARLKHDTTLIVRGPGGDQ